MKKLDIEKELLESLLASRELFDSKKFIFIKSFFEKKFSMISNVFILHHHFGQVEEYYVFMVNGEFILPVEIYNNKIVEYEIYDIKTYCAENRKMPKLFRRRMEIARDISAAPERRETRH